VIANFVVEEEADIAMEQVAGGIALLRRRQQGLARSFGDDDDRVMPLQEPAMEDSQ